MPSVRADNEDERIVIDDETDASESEATEPDLGETTEKRASANKKSGRRELSFSISSRGLVIAAAIIILTGAVGSLAWLYVGAQGRVDAQILESENNAHAEKTALDYAVNAAAMNFQDMNAWEAKLVAGTSPELTDKLTKAATSMEQILVPLQWTSTATPLAAKVRSTANGIYVVDSFVSVLTKTIQAPDALQSTATYSIAIDSNRNWQITDVGGIGDVAGRK